MNITARMLAATAAFGLAFAPIAAQANTRASDNAAVYGTSGPGLGREDEGESIFAGIPLVFLTVIGGVIIASIVVASDAVGGGDGDDQSPGT